MKDTLHEDRHTFMIISRSVLLRMRNFSDKICTETRNTHFVLGKDYFFRKWYRLCDNVEKHGINRIGHR
jgi:hypothetical protein